LKAGGEGFACAHADVLRVLVVEDDAHLLGILVNLLERLGHSVRGTTVPPRALQLLEQEPADVILSDLRMPEMDGLSLMRAVLARHPDAKVVVMTGFASGDDAASAVRDGAYSCLAKPFKFEEVVAVLRGAARDAIGVS